MASDDVHLPQIPGTLRFPKCFHPLYFCLFLTTQQPSQVTPMRTWTWQESNDCSGRWGGQQQSPYQNRDHLTPDPISSIIACSVCTREGFQCGIHCLRSCSDCLPGPESKQTTELILEQKGFVRQCKRRISLAGSAVPRLGHVAAWALGSLEMVSTIN